MRELSLNEVNAVSGGGRIRDFFDKVRDNVRENSGKIARGVGKVGGRVYAGSKAFEAGYAIGQLINEHTDIQDHITDGLDEFDRWRHDDR